MKTKTIVRNAKKFLSKKAPELWVWFGMTSMLASIPLAVRATPPAMEKIEDKKKELDKEKLTVVETVQATWKCYTATAVTATVGALSVKKGLNLSLAVGAEYAAALVTEKERSEAIKSKAKEILGDEKVNQIERSVVDDRRDKALANLDPDDIPRIGNGSTIFYDDLTGMVFYSDKETVRGIFNDLNNVLNDTDYISMNDYRDAFKYEQVSIGNILGWNRHRDGLLRPEYIKNDGKPGYTIIFDILPRENYDKFA